MSQIALDFQFPGLADIHMIPSILLLTLVMYFVEGTTPVLVPFYGQRCQRQPVNGKIVILCVSIGRVIRKPIESTFDFKIRKICHNIYSQ